jgi:Tfp pilus assembly protein PilW
MLIAMAIFGTMLAAAFSIFSTGLQTKRGEDIKLGVQQNVRAAMQIISQDLRSAGVMHLYNQNPCTNSVCSTGTQVSILALDGTNTPVASAPGTTPSATQTLVCDSSQFAVNDIAVLYNGTSIAAGEINTGFKRSQVLQITGPLPTHHTGACASTSGGYDTLTHNTRSVTDVIANDGQSYVFKARLLTYRIQADPDDSSRNNLYQLSGAGATATPPVVAYDIKSLKVSYGVRVNATSSSVSKIIFYDTLALAAAGQTSATYTDTPGPNYIGGLVTAVRITLTGESNSKLPNSSEKFKFSLSETVDLRN